MSRPSLYPEQQLRRRAMSWAIKLKVNPKQVVIEYMPERWGSCTSDRVVTFTEDLAMAEGDFQDYVIVHELLHLRYPNHGKQFQAMMTAMVPSWRELEGRTRHSSK